MNRWPICGLRMTRLLRAPAVVCFALTTLLSSRGLSQTQSCLATDNTDLPTYGCWENFIQTDFWLEAIHAVVVPVDVSGAKVGMVLMWMYNGPDGITRPRLWDPRDGSFTDVAIDTRFTGKSTPFCAGHSFLPNGNLIVTGGDELDGGNNDILPVGTTNVLEFDPSTVPPSWQQLASLLDPVDPALPPDSRGLAGGRWYPTTLTIKIPGPDPERVYTFSGRNRIHDPIVQTNKTVERYTPGATAPWELWARDSAPSGGFLDRQWYTDWYPRLHLMATGSASGKVFHSGQDRQGWLYDPAIGLDGGTPWAASAISNQYSGTSVLLPPARDGRVMIAGGFQMLPDGGLSCHVSNAAEIIDFTSTSPSWLDAGTMSSPRQNLNAVTLPDNQVLFVGGETACSPVNGGDSCGNCTPVYTADLFNPVGGTWLTIPPPAPSQRRPRQYHSTAVLLPDGRVLVAGGDTDFCTPDGGGFQGACLCPGGCPTGQIYKPGYLFRGARPTITSSPTTISYGTQFTVNASGLGLTNVLLIRPGSVTHGFNNEQRSVPLHFTQDVNGLHVDPPENTDVARYEAPAGYYMLFVVSGLGANQIPSEAKWVQLTDPTTNGFWSRRRR